MASVSVIRRDLFVFFYCLSVLFLFSGGRNYRLLPLHSQIPREDQRRVFERVPEGVRKVRFTTSCSA
jgi:HrpA-like RNA helicase